MKFLIIDDEPEVREVLRLYFESRDHDCLHAENGKEGLRMARELKPAAICLDVAMPEMSGFEVLTIIRNDPEISSIPVLMMTGVTSESGKSDEEWARSVGANEFITKPFQLDDLLVKLERLIHQ